MTQQTKKSEQKKEQEIPELTPEQKEAVFQERLNEKLEEEIDLDALSKEDLSLSLRRIPLTIGGKKGYFLEQLDGARRDLYNKGLYGDHMTRMANGDWIVTKHVGFYANLLQHCVVKPEGGYVGVDEIQSWPSELQDKLYRAARKLSGLDPKAKETARKN